MKKLSNDAWGIHSLENETAINWSNTNFAPLFDKIESTLRNSKHPFEMRIAAFWLYKIGQWFPDHFFLPSLIALALKRLKPMLENDDIEYDIKNAIKEDISQLERFQKEIAKV